MGSTYLDLGAASCTCELGGQPAGWVVYLDLCGPFD